MSSVHHIWWCTKGTAITWDQNRLCQTGKDCLGMWLWASGTPVESVFQERPPTTAYLWWNSQVDLFSLSLCLVKEGFFLGKLRKRSEPSTAVRQAIWGNSEARQGFILHCQCYVGRTQLQCTKAFSFFLSLNTNTLFQDLTSLREGPKTASWKESLSYSHKRCSGRGTPWCHPKAGDTTSWPAMRPQRRLSLELLQPCPWQTDNQISYASFMVSVAQEWRSSLASSAPVPPLGRIDLDSRDDQ
jgi:hypothetical protein